MASTARNQTLRQADDSTEWNERRGHGQENLGVDSSKVQASKEQVRKFYHYISYFLAIHYIIQASKA